MKKGNQADGNGSKKKSSNQSQSAAGKPAHDGTNDGQEQSKKHQPPPPELDLMMDAMDDLNGAVGRAVGLLRIFPEKLQDVASLGRSEIAPYTEDEIEGLNWIADDVGDLLKANMKAVNEAMAKVLRAEEGGAK